MKQTNLFKCICMFITGYFRKADLCLILYLLQNKEKKHRTNLYAFIVTELLDEWEDGQVMGKTGVTRGDN